MTCFLTLTMGTASGSVYAEDASALKCSVWEWLQLTRLQAAHKPAGAIKSGGSLNDHGRVCGPHGNGLQDADEQAQCPLIEWWVRKLLTDFQNGAVDPFATSRGAI
jgi:hypothetical protein